MKEKIYWIMLLCVMACLGIYGSSNMFSTEKAAAQAEFDQDGFRFSGNKVKGKAEGQGMLLTQKGNVYIGGFSKGRFEGVGQLNFADGASYQGVFKEGRMVGEGQLKVPETFKVFNSGKSDEVKATGKEDKSNEN